MRPLRLAAFAMMLAGPSLGPGPVGLFALLLMSSFSLLAGTGRWTTTGPEGGDVTAVAMHPGDPSILYAGTNGSGIFRSSDGGITWSESSNGLTDGAILTIAIAPSDSDTIYAGTFYGLVFKSTNGGASWSRIGSGLPQTITVEQIAVDPRDPNVLYAAINVFFLNERGGVYKSTNGGATWTAVNSGILAARMNTLAIDPSTPSTLYAGCHYRCESDFRLYKSTNSGSSWSTLTISQAPFAFLYAIVVDPRSSSKVWVLTDPGEVYRSTNGGTSWSRASGLPFTSAGTALALDRSNSSVLYYGSSSGVHKSTNSGANFSAASSGLAGARITALAANDQLVVAGARGDGIFRSTDAAASWAVSSKGFNATTVLSLAIDPRNAATTYAGTRLAHVFRTTDFGASWSRLRQGLGLTDVHVVAVDPRNSSTLYAGGLGGSSFYKSTDGGASWRTAGGVSGGLFALAIDHTAPDTLYGGTEFGIVKSTNAGSSWSPANNGLPSPAPRVLDIEIDPHDAATVYAALAARGIAKSTNRGSDWTIANNGLTNLNVNELAIDTRAPGTVYAATSGGVFKSTDSGTNWSLMNSGLTNPSSRNVQSIAVDPMNPSVVYAGTLQGVFRSSDGAANWSAFGDGLGDRAVFALAIDPTGNTIHAGTDGGDYVYQFTAPVPEIAILSPAPASTIRNGSSVVIEVRNFSLECPSGQPNGFAQGHWGLYVDGTADANLDSTNCTTSATLRRIYPSGSHTLTASLRNHDGSPLSPPVQASVTVTIQPDPSYTVKLSLPGQARAAGAAGSFFRTSVWMTNPAQTTVSVRLRFVPAAGAGSGGAAEARYETIEPRRSVAYADVLAEAFGVGTSTSGVILVEVAEGQPVPLVTSRTYNDAGSAGTFGQYIPAVPIDLSSNELWIHGLSGDAASRSNVGVVNLSVSDLTATISVWDATGARRGNDVPVTVTARSLLQTNRINDAAGAGTLTNFSVRVIAPSRSFFAYASKLDNTTSDPIFIPGTLTPKSLQWIDGVGAVAGAGGTFFRSNLSIANRGPQPATATIRFRRRGETSEAATKELTLNAGESRLYGDAVQELFGLTGVAGTLSITSTGPITAWARTYNDRGAAGTLGQFIPGVGAEEMIELKGAVFQGLSENADFRTNMGLFNIASTGASVTVTAYAANGTPLGEKTYSLAAGQAIFIARIFADLGASSVSNGYLLARPSIAKAIYGWTSYVDNTSTDQTFVRPLLIP